MSIIDNFVEKKKAESTYVTLGDGESAVIKELLDIKVIEKSGFGGEQKEVLRLICAVETAEGIKEKFFDNGTQKWAQELQEKGIVLGNGFTIRRDGLQTKTRYSIADVVKSAPAPVAPRPAAPAPVEKEVPLDKVDLTPTPAVTPTPATATPTPAPAPIEAPAPAPAPMPVEDMPIPDALKK